MLVQIYFPLFQTHFNQITVTKTKENQLWNKDKIESQQI